MQLVDELSVRDQAAIRRLVDAGELHAAAKMVAGLTNCGMSVAIARLKRAFPHIEREAKRERVLSR